MAQTSLLIILAHGIRKKTVKSSRSGKKVLLKAVGGEHLRDVGKRNRLHLRKREAEAVSEGEKIEK